MAKRRKPGNDPINGLGEPTMHPLFRLLDEGQFSVWQNERPDDCLALFSTYSNDEILDLLVDNEFVDLLDMMVHPALRKRQSVGGQDTTAALTKEEQALALLASDVSRGKKLRKVDIARRVGVNPRTLGNWPNFNLARKIAKAKEGRPGYVDSDGQVDGIVTDNADISGN